MTKEEIKEHLHDIGFSGFEPLKKEHRDGKKRLAWTFPAHPHSDWLRVILVEEDDNLVIELLRNPHGQTFDREDVVGLINYIRKDIFRR